MPTVKIRYEVRLNPGNSVNIKCFNDYYYDSGTLKQMHFKSNYGLWFSSRIGNAGEEYYLEVAPDTLLADTVNFSASVFINDTLRDSFSSATKFNTITLKGKIQ